MTPIELTVLVGVSLSCAAGPWWWTRRRPARPATGGRRSSLRRTRATPPPLDDALLLELIDVAIAAGASIPRALSAVGSALGGAQGDALVRAGTALLLGASWVSAWSDAGAAHASDLPVALEAAWSTGSAPGPALRGRAEQVRRDRRTRGRAAAGALGVRLVLPLGLCFLPAFVLLGLVPMLLSLAGDLLR